MKSSNAASLPVVGITCCTFQKGVYPTHGVGDKYVHVVVDGVKGLPLLIPAVGSQVPAHEWLRRLDGLLIPGSPSNIEPAHYQGEPSDPGTLHDPARDVTNLPLIKAALDMAIPVLAICRGLQELNVAMGGSLHQKVHQVPGHMDHRHQEAESYEARHRLKHPVTLTEGGLLATLTGKRKIQVNSMHGQGIKRLAPGLAVEAVSPDGLVEAVRVTSAKTFALGVQWHTEWRYWENPDYAAIIRGFAEAVHQRAQARF